MNCRYTGVVLYDHNLEALGSPRLVADYLPSLRAVITAAHEHGLEVVPQIYSFGHSVRYCSSSMYLFS